MVWAGRKMFTWMAGAPPITWVTAIASPTARPRPSMTAAMIPGREYGRTVVLIISQRVPPRARAPSLAAGGTVVNTSRVRLETIGTVMIVRITIAGERPTGEEVAPNRGVEASGGVGAAEQGDPAERRMQSGLDRDVQERPQDEDAPEPEDHAWHAGEELDEGRDRGPGAPRGHLRQDEGDRDRQWRGEQ